MAFGIDDALSALAGGINLTTTLVETLKRYRKKGDDPDLELLLQEVRITAVKKIDDMDLALTQFERMLREQKIDLDKKLETVIANTPFWKPWQAHKLKQIHKIFNQSSDSIYSACDDICGAGQMQESMARHGYGCCEQCYR
jgi:stage III sporulation protein SpoIIIAA